MNRDAAFDRDCRALMEGLPATGTGQAMPPGGLWKLDLSQRAVDILYRGLAVLMHGPQPEPNLRPGPIVPDPPKDDESLSAMLGPALAATIRIALKQEK